MATSRDAFEAIQAKWEAERLARKQEKEERAKFVAEAVAKREARERGELPPIDLARDVPTLTTVFQEKRAAELESEMLAEQERLQALTPRDIWMSTLSFQERERVSAWQNVNRMLWPMPNDD